MSASRVDSKSDSVNRQTARQLFLESCSLGAALEHPLAQDASFRRYFRITENAPLPADGSTTAPGGTTRSYILMDAPPDKEPVAPFLQVRAHLENLGLRPPRLFQADPATGFVLLEDLGHNTFTQLLNQGADPLPLYSQAVDVLTTLHNHNQALSIDVPEYDVQRLVDEAALFAHWYVPAICGQTLDDQALQEWRIAWHSVLTALPAQTSTLVLRDFHVDNLMRIEDRDKEQCALLDFQDAVAGPAAYDLVSLLEDARRDLAPDLINTMSKRYLKACEGIDEAAFLSWYEVLGAQRHAKVLGIFMRLWIRDDKPIYLQHMPRVTRLFTAKHEVGALRPIWQWLEEYLPHMPAELPAMDREQIRAACAQHLR